MTKMFDLSSKNMLITGATGAIGRAIVATFVEQGANVFLASSTNSTNDLEEMSLKPNIIGYLASDLTTEGACEFLLKSALEATTKFYTLNDGSKNIDILVNCAGISIDNLFIRISDEEWDKQFSINLRSLWKITQLTLRHMMRNKSGRVISISSVIGRTGNIGQTAYAATKSAMYGMSKSLAREVATRGITVNCISPGFIESPMTEKLTANIDLKNKILSDIPVGYIGQPIDVAAAALYLASDEARYVTGTDLSVSGGMYMN